MYYPNLLTSDEFQNRRNSGCPFFIRLLQKNSYNTGFWESLAHFLGLSTGQKWMTTRWSNFDAVYHVMHDSTRYEVKKLLDLLDSNGISNTLALSYRFKGELFLQWLGQTDFLFCHNLDECLCPHIDFPSKVWSKDRSQKRGSSSGLCLMSVSGVRSGITKLGKKGNQVTKTTKAKKIHKWHFRVEWKMTLSQNSSWQSQPLESYLSYFLHSHRIRKKWDSDSSNLSWYLTLGWDELPPGGASFSPLAIKEPRGLADI